MVRQDFKINDVFEFGKTEMGNWIDKKEWLNNNEDEDRKKDSKVIVADFDPRSPSNGIVR